MGKKGGGGKKGKKGADKGKGKGKGKEEEQDDPSIVRMPLKANGGGEAGAAAGDADEEGGAEKVVQVEPRAPRIALPAPILPVFREEAVNAETCDWGSEEKPFTDFAGEGLWTLPPEFPAETVQWRRPNELVGMEYFASSEAAEEAVTDEAASNPFVVIDTAPWQSAAEEKVAAEKAAKLEEAKAKDDEEWDGGADAAGESAEENGEEGEGVAEEDAVVFEVARDMPNLLIHEEGSGEKGVGFMEHFATVYDTVQALSISGREKTRRLKLEEEAAEKARQEAMTEEEREAERAAAAEAEAAAKAAAEAAAAEAAKSKSKGKKGKGDANPAEDAESNANAGPPPFVQDANDPVPSGSFLWEAIYPKDERELPRLNPGGKYSVRLFHAGAWRRVDIDDRIPVLENGAPLLCSSKNKFELWPLLLSKALCKLVRGQWALLNPFAILNYLTGFAVYERVKGEVWTSLLPLIDHTKIEYGDEEADAEVQLPLDSAAGEEGSIESIPGDAELEAELGVDGEGGENEDGGADGDGEMGSEDGGDGGHEGGQERVPPPAFFYIALCGTKEAVFVDGHEKVGIEADLNDLDEEDDGPERFLKPGCVYALMGTRGGDDDVPEENLEETARTQFGEEDMEDELDDDRDFRVHLHGRNAWITLDSFKAAFEEDTHGGTAGRIVALVDPNSEWFMHKSKTERHMSWKWQKEATLEGEQTDGQEEASDGNAEDVANANGEEAENPVRPGRWKLCQSSWEGRKILLFPAAADDDDATTIAAPVDGQEDTSATAADEVRDGENGGQDGTDGANGSGVPRLTFSDADADADLERDAYDRLVMITIFNDAAPKGDIPQSKTRLWVRRLSLDNLTHVDTILSSVTSNVASAIFKVPAIESGEKGVAYEFDVDAPAGFVINVSTRLKHSILDAYSPNVQASLLSRNVISREGSFPAVLEDQWQILQSWSFKVEGQSSGDEEEADSAPEPRELMLGCNLHIFDPMVAPHVRVCIVNRDTHEWRYFPTLEMPWQRFVSNTSGYSVLLVAHCRRANLPSSSWRMDFFASSSLAFSGDEVGSDEAAAESVLLAEAQAATITDYRDNYIPNRYWRLMRDVVSIPEDESCETIALRLTVSDPTAVVRLAAYAEASGEEIVSIQGRGEMSLLDVPTKVMVKPKATQEQKENDQRQDEDGGAEGEEEEQMVESQVIIDAQLQPSSWDAPPELSSVRPYHYPKRQPGDAVPSALQWDLRIVGAASIGLARDRAVELKEDAIRQGWEEAQEGRAAMAASHREHILYTARSRTATQAEGIDASGEGKNEGGAVTEEGSAEIPDGLEGLDEEEREKELSRRKDFASVKDKLPCVPHINPKTIKYRRVKRLGKLTAEVEEANAAAMERANELLQRMEQKRADEKMQWEARGKKVEADMLSRRQASMERFSSLWAARSSK